MKIALFGGSFDPPHNGHSRIIESVLDSIELDLLLVLVAYQNPLKAQYRVDSKKRFTWMQTLTRSYKKVLCSDYEIMQNKPTTTIESVRHFKACYNPKEIYFILGQDNFFQLPQWSEFATLRKEVGFVVFDRMDSIDSKNIDVSTKENKEKLHAFAKEHNLSMRHIHFSYPYSSSLIVQNLARYKAEIPKDIRDDVLESYKQI